MTKTMAKEKKAEKANYDKTGSIYTPVRAELILDSIPIDLRRDIILGLGESVEDYLNSIKRWSEVHVEGKVTPDGDLINRFSIKSLDNLVEGSVYYLAQSSQNNDKPHIKAEFNFNSERYEDREGYEGLCKLVRAIDTRNWEKDIERKRGDAAGSLTGLGLFGVGLVGAIATHQPALGIGGAVCGIFFGIFVGSYVEGSYWEKQNRQFQEDLAALREKLKPKRYYPVQLPRKYEGEGIPPAATLDEERA